MLSFCACAVIALFEVLKISHIAFPFMTTGKPLGLPGFLPTALLFAAIVSFTVKNTITADIHKITFHNSLFFFLNTRFSEEWKDIDEIRVIQSMGNIYTIFLIKGPIKIRTFLRGPKDQIEKIAEKMNSLKNSTEQNS